MLPPFPTIVSASLYVRDISLQPADMFNYLNVVLREIYCCRCKTGAFKDWNPLVFKSDFGIWS